MTVITAPRIGSTTLSSSTTVSCNVSSLSAIAGELIIIVAESQTIAAAPSSTPPTGYALYHASASNVRVKCYVKVAAGSDGDVNVTFSSTGSQNIVYAAAIPGAYQSTTSSKDTATD